MAIAQFRFYEELNDFLVPERRKREFEHRCARGATVKNAIEALGVPHTEVELILVNGCSVDFGYRVRDGDRISVYPMFETFDVAPLVRVRARPLRVTRFIADSQLGGLARLLRVLGFDTVYENGYPDHEIRRRAAEEGRLILTRDRALLKFRTVTHGCYVHATEPRAQLKEIVERLQLGASARPFTLCVECNTALVAVAKENVLDRLPPAVAQRHEEFHACTHCGRVYWQGSHFARMHGFVQEILAGATASTAATGPGSTA